MSSRITELAVSIAENTAIVSKFLTENNLPQPSLEIGGSLRFPIPPGAIDIENARDAVIDATEELKVLLMGPTEYVTNVATATYEHVASKIGLPTSTTKRIIRHAITRNVFKESKDGKITHNAVSAALVEDPRLADFMGANLDEWWQAAAQTVNNLVTYPDSEEPNQTGFNLAHHTDKLFYQELDGHPDRAKRFSSAMSILGQNPDLSLSYVVTGYDWAALGDGLVVDIGGSHAELSKVVGSAHPQLSFVNQDLEPVIASAAEIPESMSSRIQMMVHDFFQPQPVKNADVYLLRWILHNWSDKYAIKILQQLIPALKDGTRVLVIDEVLPVFNTVSRRMEKKLRDLDLLMLEIFNSKEREIEDWKTVFEKADSRFKLQTVARPPGSRLWIMELVWKP